MLFSIIVPYFNNQDTLRGCVESCLYQSFQNFELILVDDASIDNSPCIAVDLARLDSRIRLITLEENRGPAIARNRAIEVARGDYLAFLDADDHWHPRKLELLSQLVRRYPDCRLYFHDVAIGSFADIPSDAEDTSPYHYTFLKLLCRNAAHTPATLLRRGSGLQFNPKMRYSEDYELWLRAAYPKGAIYLPLPLAVIGRPVGSKGGLSSDRWQMRRGEMMAYLSFVMGHPLFLPLLPLMWAWSLMKHLRSAVIGLNLSGDRP